MLDKVCIQQSIFWARGRLIDGAKREREREREREKERRTVVAGGEQ
jgi:hypothetical protein